VALRCPDLRRTHVICGTFDVYLLPDDVVWGLPLRNRVCLPAQYYLYNWRCPEMPPAKVGLVLL
jgi:hypothetical protein